MLENGPSGEGGESPTGIPEKDSPFLRRAGLYIAVGFEVPSTILGGLLVGYLLDRYFDTSPWLLISATFVAFVAACLRLVRWVQFFQKRVNYDGSKPDNRSN